jgi:hypothetical protein
MVLAGVVYSWRAGVDGQQEYVLQVEPEILQSSRPVKRHTYERRARRGGQVQRLCIVVLPKGGTAAAHTQLAEDRFRQLALTASRYASNDPASPPTRSQRSSGSRASAQANLRHFDRLATLTRRGRHFCAD